jgi:hypothetical protein
VEVGGTYSEPDMAIGATLRAHHASAYLQRSDRVLCIVSELPVPAYCDATTSLCLITARKSPLPFWLSRSLWKIIAGYNAMPPGPTLLCPHPVEMGAPPAPIDGTIQFRHPNVYQNVTDE